jgi:hypothetical protein
MLRNRVLLLLPLEQYQLRSHDGHAFLVCRQCFFVESIRSELVIMKLFRQQPALFRDSRHEYFLMFLNSLLNITREGLVVLQQFIVMCGGRDSKVLLSLGHVRADVCGVLVANLRQ